MPKGRELFLRTGTMTKWPPGNGARAQCREQVRDAPSLCWLHLAVPWGLVPRQPRLPSLSLGLTSPVHLKGVPSAPEGTQTGVTAASRTLSGFSASGLWSVVMGFLGDVSREPVGLLFLGGGTHLACPSRPRGVCHLEAVFPTRGPEHDQGREQSLAGPPSWASASRGPSGWTHASLQAPVPRLRARLPLGLVNSPQSPMCKPGRK